MKRLVLATGALGALLVLAAHGRSSEDKELVAIIDKAIAAHGGEANLAKYPAQTATGTGKFYGLGEAIDFNLEVASHDKKFRYGMDMKVMNFDLKITIVVSGAKGWEKVNDDVKEIGADELAEYEEQMYRSHPIPKCRHASAARSTTPRSPAAATAAIPSAMT
jgi:hypothetical protein